MKDEIFKGKPQFAFNKDPSIDYIRSGGQMNLKDRRNSSTYYNNENSMSDRYNSKGRKEVIFENRVTEKTEELSMHNIIDGDDDFSK